MRSVFKLLWPFVLNGSVTNHTLYTQPWHGLFLGLHGRVLLEFNGAREDNRDRDIDHPAGRHSTRTNQRPTSIIPPFLRRMPFLPQPSHFTLACMGQAPNMLACIPSGVVYPVTFVISLRRTCRISCLYRVKWRHTSVVAIRSPFCGATPSYCAWLSGEDLSRYSNKIE